MWASAKINQITASVGSNFRSIGYLTLDSLNLKGVLLEQLKSVFFGEHKTLEVLFFSHDLIRSFVNIFVVFIREERFSCICIIEETCLSGWSVT